MPMNYILAIDQGTTGTRAYIFDKHIRPVTSAYQEFRQYYPKPGWVEHDAEEIWQSVRRVITKSIKMARINPQQIAAIGITNQRETTVLWDRKTSRPTARAIVWQCRRTADMCETLKKRGLEPLFRKKTGLLLDPYFSGTKIAWLLEHSPALRKRARAGNVCFGTIDSWLIWKLTGGVSHLTDYTNASRTLCFNIHRKRWDRQLLRILKIPSAIFPRAVPSVSNFGRTGRLGFLPSGIPISGVAGDQQAALFGQGCVEPGDMKNTYGTGCFLMINSGQKAVRSTGGLLTTLACDRNGMPCYALEGAVFIAGAVIQWLRDEVGLIRKAAETEQIARRLKDAHGVYVVPAFVGLGAPYWNARVRGIITGLTRGAGRNDIVRAALESLAYQTRDLIERVRKETRQKIYALKVDGGASSNNFLMQFQADILGIPIDRPRILETTARGAALLAGLSAGLYSNKNLTPPRQRRFTPKMKKARRKELYDGWLHAVKQALA